MAEKLLPCPFCGSNKVHTMHADSVKCFSCKAWGPTDDIDGSVWNLRNTTDAETIKALREALEKTSLALEAMAECAFKIGLEGTSDWDKIAGGADLHGAIDAARAALSRSE